MRTSTRVFLIVAVVALLGIGLRLVVTPSPTVNTNSYVTDVQDNMNARLYHTFTHPTSRYSLRFPSDWHRTSEGQIETFAAVQGPPTDSCLLKVSVAGLLGRDTTLAKGPDETIAIAGVTTTKRTWIGPDAEVSYYNFELSKNGQVLGVEGVIGADVADCNTELSRITDSLILN